MNTVIRRIQMSLPIPYHHDMYVNTAIEGSPAIRFYRITTRCLNIGGGEINGWPAQGIYIGLGSEDFPGIPRELHRRCTQIS